jgi:hypothetical protein
MKSYVSKQSKFRLFMCWLYNTQEKLFKFKFLTRASETFLAFFLLYYVGGFKIEYLMLLSEGNCGYGGVSLAHSLFNRLSAFLDQYIS